METQVINPIANQPKPEKRYYTPEEYLALEETAIDKSEYHDGEIIQITGGTANHNKIALNFCRQFLLSMNDQDYEIFISDVRLWIPEIRRYFYPDIMVIQGQPIYQGNKQTNVTNPLMIIEILSDSTENYDRGNKFRFYRSIPELQEYILIDQYSYHIEQFAKNSKGKWELTEYESQESILTLESLELQIPLTDIYQRINFVVKEEDHQP